MRLTPSSLRGLAHPLRVRMLGILREHGPATATLLAQRLGQSTGATSYHLRQLAAYGFVVEETGRAVRRERWWKAAHRETLFDGQLRDDAPEDADAYVRALAALYADRVDNWIGELPTITQDWRDSATLSDWRLRLTPDECRELHDAIFELVRRNRRDDGPGVAPDRAKLVVFQVQIMPFTGAGR